MPPSTTSLPDSRKLPERPFRTTYSGDARNLRELTSTTKPARARGLDDGCVDLVVTSPPYWRKRDYGVEGQLGQEPTAKEYVDNLAAALAEWKRVLRPTGSIFLNIGDTYRKKSLAGIPGQIEVAARDLKLAVRNRIVWVKTGGAAGPGSRPTGGSPRVRPAPRRERVLLRPVRLRREV